MSKLTTYHLEMLDRNLFRPRPAPPGVALVHVESPNPELNRYFYRQVGGPWNWSGRLKWSDEDWQNVIDTNLGGVFKMTRAVTRPMMKQRTGSIINVSSVIGLVGNAGQVNYAAAKAGILGLTKSAARELATRNIRVNAIAPGFIETDMTAELPEDVRDKVREQIALHSFGTPEDVASSVAFFASDDAAYITGQVLAVDGGMTFV